MTSPVVRCLKLQQDAEIHYLTKKSFAAIVATNPYISKVYTIDKKVSEVSTALRKEQYDFVIDLHHNLRSFLVKWAMPFVKSYSFKKLNFEKWLMVNFKINKLPEKHIVDRYLETVKPLGVKNDGKGLDFFLGQDRASFKNLAYLKEQLHHYIAFPIGAGRNTKALSVEKVVAICQSIDYPVVLLGGKMEVEKAVAIERVLAEFPPPSPLQRGRTAYVDEKSGDINELVSNSINKKGSQVINLVGKCSLLESAAIVKNAAVVLTGDTGLMHIAAAFRKRIVSIWGNTIPEFGMYPYYENRVNRNNTFEQKELSCRPCSKLGYHACPKGHFKCMQEIDIEGIIEAARLGGVDMA